MLVHDRNDTRMFKPDIVQQYTLRTIAADPNIFVVLAVVDTEIRFGALVERGLVPRSTVEVIQPNRLVGGTMAQLTPRVHGTSSSKPQHPTGHVGSSDVEKVITDGPPCVAVEYFQSSRGWVVGNRRVDKSQFELGSCKRMPNTVYKYTARLGYMYSLHACMRTPT